MAAEGLEPALAVSAAAPPDFLVIVQLHCVCTELQNPLPRVQAL